jgi:branched-chain amino acid transport system substrate-binding protein
MRVDSFRPLARARLDAVRLKPIRCRPGVLIAAIVAAAALSACGSSSSSSSSGSSSGSAVSSSSSSSSSTPAAAGSSSGSKVPYKLGVMASESGPLASSVGGYGPTMQAWAKWTNAHGGIAGHQVDLIVMDDGGNPTTAVTDVKQMVEQDHVIALINASGSEEAYASFLGQEGVAAVGGLDSDPIYETTGDFFSQGTPPTTTTIGELKEAAARGYKHVGIMYCSEVAACAAEVPRVKALSKPYGISTVYAGAISSSAPNYTAPCLAAKAADATVLYVSAAAAQQLEVGTDCQQQGLHAPLLTGDINFTNEWLKTPAANGAISINPSFPFTENDTPATRAFHDALKQYDASVLSSSSYGTVEASAWTSGQLFAAAAKAANMGNSPSAQGLKKGLYALKNDTLGGLSGPITYVHGKNPNAKEKCYFVMQIKNGKFVASDKPSCL